MFDSKNGQEINKFNAHKISWIPNQAQVNQLSASIPVVVVVFTSSLLLVVIVVVIVVVQVVK
jgi:hypothetical protein